MKAIFNAGVSEELKSYLNDKIRISNQVALLMAGVGLFYTVFPLIVMHHPVTQGS